MSQRNKVHQIWGEKASVNSVDWNTRTQGQGPTEGTSELIDAIPPQKKKNNKETQLGQYCAVTCPVATLEKSCPVKSGRALRRRKDRRKERGREAGKERQGEEEHRKNAIKRPASSLVCKEPGGHNSHSHKRKAEQTENRSLSLYPAEN